MNIFSNVLASMLETMDIPESRKEITERNLLWLRRNLRINNGAHPEVNSAMEMIDYLLAEKD